MANKLLLVKDVAHLGRSGDIVSVKPGFARNYLVPQGLAVAATKGTLRMQERLQEERKQRALEERRDAEEVARRLEDVILETTVKVDPEGHMYGSVAASDILDLLKHQTALEVDKKSLQLKNPIKKVGEHNIEFKFKEDVTATIKLRVIAEGEREVLQVEPAVEETGA